ncbi:MAG: VacB/RNase II family 3'-5' exoribonuclease [Bacillota bacterium]
MKTRPELRLGPGELLGTISVLRGGRVLVAGDRNRPLLAIPPDLAVEAGVMHGDTVVARRIRRRGRAVPAASTENDRATRNLPAGQVVRVLRRAAQAVVGTYERSGREEWVVPDDWRLGPRVTVRGGALGAPPGEKVVVALSSYPGPGRPVPAGSVVERLGPAGAPDAETLAILRSFGLRESFDPEVLAEAERLPGEVGPDEREGRLDLTAETVFTIDDAEARDLDDAVSVAGPADGRGWRLGVHIADVAHYVKPGTALDKEAMRRGTSVYLVDRVLPMFPPRLSNGIASLNPSVDRLTLSVLMDVDRRGRVTGYELRRSVIRTVGRLTYDEVAAFLEPEFGETLVDGPSGSGGSGRLSPEVRAALREMAELAGLLRRRRLARGSLDFDIAEEKVRLDGEGRPLEVVLRPRNVATQIIEEFMIAANEAVADFLLWSGVPYMARIHEEPFPDDLEALRTSLAPLGYRVPTRAPRAADLQAILETSRGRPEGPEVHSALLRALPQARYSAVRHPHFALASPNYLHFTSPIRRYPDLTVHRQVIAVLEGRRHDEPAGTAAPEVWLEAVAEACSRAERTAEQAERESLRLKKAELAQCLLGWEDDGVVVDVFDFGTFVRLPNGVEGLIPAEGQGAGRLRAGDRVKAQIVRVDVSRRRVELALRSSACAEGRSGVK